MVWKEDERDKTNIYERKHRNEQENEAKLLADVHALETKLEIKTRWMDESEEWRATKKLVREASYRKALEGLDGFPHL